MVQSRLVLKFGLNNLNMLFTFAGPNCDLVDVFFCFQVHYNVLGTQTGTRVLDDFLTCS